MKNCWPACWIKWILLLSGSLSIVFTVVVCFQSFKFWRELKGNLPGWIGKVHRADKTLGYAPIPISSGAMVLADGSTIPVFYDSHGFRSDSQEVFESRLSEESQPNYIMGLGCSFTFGFGVQAKSAFCHRIADKLEMVPLNAGRCSYGLAEMLILARQFIPKLKPKIVLAQYSPWLVQRSQHRYAPTFYGLLPHPYFSDGGGSSLIIHRPDFNTAIFEKDLASFRRSDGNFWGLLNFTLNFGCPLFFHDFYNLSLVAIKNLVGLIPEPSKNQALVETEAYGEIASICKQFDSQMFVVVLGSSNSILNLPGSLNHLNLRIVNAQLELVKRLTRGSEREYARNYYHWGSVPRRVIDKHPNELAHEIIANAVVKFVSETLLNERN